MFALGVSDVTCSPPCGWVKVWESFICSEVDETACEDSGETWILGYREISPRALE